MRVASIIASVAFACTTSPTRANDLRVPSPDRRFVAVYHYSPQDAQLVERISFTDSSGHGLFIDDYATRDYRPQKGQWTRSGRFFVYSLYSRGGHSPWHKAFVIADIQTQHCTPESEIGKGDSISDFRLSGSDTISYKILDRSKESWDPEIPGIAVQFSLSQKFANQ
jgi:hypothetical protein